MSVRKLAERLRAERRLTLWGRVEALLERTDPVVAGFALFYILFFLFILCVALVEHFKI